MLMGVSIDPTAPFIMYLGSVRLSHLNFPFKVHQVGSSLSILMHVGSIATSNVNKIQKRCVFSDFIVYVVACTPVKINF